MSSESELFREGARKGYFATKEDGSVYMVDSGLVGALHKEEDFRGVDTVKRSKKRDKLPTVPVGGLIDFSNPSAVQWFKDKHRKLLKDGVDLFITDFGEIVPIDAKFHNGMSGREMRNLYGLLYNKTVFEVIEETS